MAELEGFICSLCKQDLKTFHHLEAHFREEHDEVSSKRRTNLKSLFDKARTFGRKKRHDHEVDEGAAAVSMRGADGEERGETPITNISGIDPEYWAPQEFGFLRDHMVEFKRIRDARISDSVVETNRLVIRLEKLFRMLKDDTPRNSKQLKVLERNVVPWKHDKEEKRCMKCRKSFGVRRRKHHCRLCGDIICKQCSSFITLSEAYVLLVDCPDYRSLNPSPSLRSKRLHLKQRKLKAAEKEEEEEEMTDEIRMCPQCQKLINRRLVNLQSLEKPLFTALYERMQLTMAEADSQKPSYLEMAESLLSGEHGYTLAAATQKRQELIRLYESVDAMSKDLLTLGDSEASQRSAKLGRGIRAYSSTYLQDNLLTLPALPTHVKLRQIREAKEREAQERIRELERHREFLRQQEAARGAGVDGTQKEKGFETSMTATVEVAEGGEGRGGGGGVGGGGVGGGPPEKRKLQDRFLEFSNKVVSNVSNVGFGNVRVGNIGFKKDSSGGSVTMGFSRSKRQNSDSGWMGDSFAVGSVDSADDPFMLQRQQLLRFIQQARQANRMDEVEALEASLLDIESAMTEEQQQLSYGFSPD